MMRRSTLLPMFLLIFLPTAGALQAQSFEGIIRQRSLTVSEEALDEMIYAGEAEDIEYDTEEAYNQATANRLFALSLQDLMASGMAELAEFAVHFGHGRVRIEGMGGGAYNLIDLESGTMWMVNPADRSYMEFAQEGVGDMEEAQGSGGEVVVTDLGETRTISGFQAGGYRAASTEEYGEAWCIDAPSGLAESLQALAKKMNQLAEEGEGASLEDAMCSGKLSVLTKTFHPYVGLFEVEEGLSIEEAPQPADLFQVPEGYRRIEMSEPWQ